MTTRRTPIAMLVASLTLASPLAASAAALGEISSLSPLGAPLHVEIGVAQGRANEIGPCLRVIPSDNADNGLPMIRRGRVSARSTEGNGRIVISSTEKVSEPIALLTLEDTCASRLRRTYTLLFPYPVASPRTHTDAIAAEPEQKPARRTGSREQWITAPGETLNGIARALYPDNPAARRAFVGKTARANPETFPDRASRSRALPAGTMLSIPSLTEISRTSPPAPARAAAPGKTTAGRTSGKATPGEPTDRLVVARDTPPSGSTPDTGSGAQTDARMTSIEAREQQVAAAIDRSIVTQMELLARIQELEQIQQRLMEQASRIGVTAPPNPPAPAQQPQASQTEAEPASNAQDWTLLAALGGGALVIAALLLLRAKRKRDEDNAETMAAMPVPAHTATETSAALTTAPAPTTQINEPTELPLTASADVNALPLEWDNTPSGFGALDADPLALEEEVEEHDSAIELAEIMMSFGRIHGAAETLADFIRGNPKQAVTPWLKLLEVYRAAGLRAEFDALARQLNKTFNVKAVTWNNFDEARSASDAFENMPHLITAVEALWGTRECQAYLHKLLRDNRDGTRQGFPLTVIDDILCLNAVLEQQLGPYRPGTDEPVTDNGPATEPPALHAG